MAAESNLGFHCYQIPGSVLGQHVVSFPSALSSASQIIPFSSSCIGINSVSVAEMMLLVNPNLGNNSSTIVQGQSSCSSSTCSLPLGSVPGLKHDTGLAVNWSPEEQYKLEEGLEKYADETSIKRYIKIAAELPKKTVRDVALRCSWMTDFSQRKRRKGEEAILGKRVNNRKQMDASSGGNSPQTEILSSFPLSSDCVAHSQVFHLDGISGPTKHLLERNTEAFSQITCNLSSSKVADNVDLFQQTRNNIDALLKELSEMPGIMMPPLNVSVDESLVNTFISTAAKCLKQKSADLIM